MKHKKISFLCILGFLLGILAILVGMLRLTINDRAYFAKLYERYDMQAQIGISAEDCTNAMMKMIGYMEGRESSIQLTVTELGQPVEMFNQQEIDHMVDVRGLYQAFCLVEYIGFAALILLLGAALLAKRPAAQAVVQAFWWALGIFGMAVLGLGAYALLDFNGFWTMFHRLFFTNDLWLMEYATCRMIRICPLELFSGIIARFVLLSLGALAVLCGALAARGKRLKGIPA
ncbi:MAG: DUF1461 domain-containing protein [Christensenellaceae bacterium]|jgi:integral membrane protein (TIGR01906 family)|nr:DUF1461 domain-containing protein [Christensenellaceae bacterium]